MRIPFDPPPGLLNNDTAYAIPGAWADVENVRFFDGKAETIGGWQAVFEASLTGVCREIIAWTNNTGVQNIAFGTHSALQVFVGGQLTAITPTGLAAGSIDSSGSGPGYGTGTYSSGPYSVPSSAYNMRTWSLHTWGETLLAAPRDGTLYQWTNDPNVPAAAVPNAPGQITAMLVTPERQVLALGCNEETSNDFNPLCIRGCAIEDLTDWSTTASNNAFEHVLEGGGHIVAGRMVGPYVAVWTDNNLHLGQFLGNPDQTYRFDRIDDNCGLLGPNAVCVLRGVAYWVGKDQQIRAWAPGAGPQIMPCPIWKDFADNLHVAQAAKLVAVSNSRFDEIWFFYPDSRDGNENSRYIALSTTSGAWFRGTLARTAASDAGTLSYPIAAAPNGQAFYHEFGTDAAGGGLQWRARSTALYFGEGEQVLQVQRIQPDFKNQDSAIFLTIYVRHQAQGEPRTKGPFRLPVGVAKKDLRFSGPIVELEWYGTGYARFGRPVFDAVFNGRR